MGKYVMSRQEFIDEAFGDGFKSALGKIKTGIKKLFASTVETAKNILVFMKDGKTIAANSPISSAEVGSKINGVYIASKQAGINTVDQYDNPGVYGLEDDDNDILLKNFNKLVQLMNEGYDPQDPEQYVNEATAGSNSQLSAEAGGLVNVEDWNMTRILRVLKELMEIQEDGKYNKPYCVWGAPGIGKTTIAKNLIKAWNQECKSNNTPEKQKSIMIVDCGQMSVDGFSLPVINQSQTLEELKRANMHIEAKAKEISATLSQDDRATMEKLLKNINIKRVEDAPKTWLPVYNPQSAQGNKDILELMDSIANGYTNEVYDKNGDITGYELHTNGGVLMFDEFLRNGDILDILMTLIKERKINDYVLGSKWYIVCCSNRPNDDKGSVERAFKLGNSAFMNRVDHINLIPSPQEWKKWALEDTDIFNDEGGRAIVDFVVSKDNKGLEYLYQPMSPDGMQKDTSTGKPGWDITQRTPRSWTAFGKKLHDIRDYKKVDDILDLPWETIEDTCATLGIEVSKQLTDALMRAIKQRKLNNGVKINDIVSNPDLVVPDTINEVFNEKTIEGYLKEVLHSFRQAYNPDTIKLENFYPLFRNLAEIIKKSNIEYKATWIHMTTLVTAVFGEYVYRPSSDGKSVWNLALLAGAKGDKIKAREEVILNTLSEWEHLVDDLIGWDTIDGKEIKKGKK